jgi:hypothetical protein
MASVSAPNAEQFSADFQTRSPRAGALDIMRRSATAGVAMMRPLDCSSEAGHIAVWEPYSLSTAALNAAAACSLTASSSLQPTLALFLAGGRAGACSQHWQAGTARVHPAAARPDPEPPGSPRTPTGKGAAIQARDSVTAAELLRCACRRRPERSRGRQPGASMRHNLPDMRADREKETQLRSACKRRSVGALWAAGRCWRCRSQLTFNKLSLATDAALTRAGALSRDCRPPRPLICLGVSVP